MTKSKIVSAIAFALGLLTAVPAGYAEEIVGRASVTDGDTLEIRGQKIRLHGVDAPESSQLCKDAAGKDYRCGQKAALALADQIRAANVTCEKTDSDRYGRVVARCWLPDLDINSWLVSEGYAMAYRQYGTDYVSEEDGARSQKRGIWAGSFVAPWDWRKGVREVAEVPGTKAGLPIPTTPRVDTATKLAPVRVPTADPAPVRASSEFSCGGKRTCGQMNSCAEARFYLNQCGVRRLDGDSDGTPCESIC
ncbi:MAG TPA: thermonuclease family protein [Microvirga sp.]|jgi:endonuclease YncB( thermonuclease family)|nr:thermonuclease family protein [Microvirga sp.]